MASSSSSSNQKRFNYDVFLSFRGEDTSKTFVDHLYHALVNRDIITYKDDEKIEKGERIGDELIRSIEESRFYIIVFSKNYASSSWCLDELVKIMECQKMTEHTAYPVFYDVEPSEVRKQRGAVGEAFAKHKNKESAGRWRDAVKEAADLSGWDVRNTADGEVRKQRGAVGEAFAKPENKESAGRWRDALKEAADLSGWDVRNTADGEVRKQRGAVGEAFAKHENKQAAGRWRWREALNHAAALPGWDPRELADSKVRKQRGAVGEAFAKHENKELAGKWRYALEEAADLPGWESKTTFDGHESKLIIQEIVEEISLKLRYANSSVIENLVGMETRVKNVVSSLDIDSDDVRMIGITGMGGAGKTTLARAVFDHISIMFEGKSFVENVREVSKDSLSGLKALQKQLLKDVLNDRNIDVTSVSDGKYKMKKMMPRRKVLLVLDDVDHKDQLEALAGEPSWFKPGSRIIITTRDAQVLAAHQANFIHDVPLLSHEEAICLFSRYAFGREIPIQRYEKLSEAVVKYAADLPLTIKVLGSSLCGKIESEWEHAIEKLKSVPLKGTLEKLELSYDGLGDDYKVIFLDIACILKGETKDKAIRVLESCGLHAQNGLRVLEQKSMTTISDDGRLLLHDHMEEMGKNIVRRLHPDEPNRHKRLWIKEEIEDILVNDLGTEATRSIKLLYPQLDPYVIMKGLSKMKRLSILHVNNLYKTDVYTSPSGSNYPSFPNALKYLYWRNYSSSYLPKAFQANHLVNLEMPHSNISQLWEGNERKILNKLRFLDLTFSRVRTFNLELTPHLEELNLRGCTDFEELHIPDECPKLRYLDLGDSKVSNHNLRLTPHLVELNLSGCYRLVEVHMPIECQRLIYLNLAGTKVSYLSLGLNPHLKKLDLGGCSAFVELHMPVECPNLEYLDLGGSKVTNFDLGLTPNLKSLYLDRCNEFVELHMPIECPKLEYLNLGGSKVTNFDLGLTPNLKSLYLGRCNEFVELHMPIECPKLEDLDLSFSKVRYLNLGLTPNLKSLYLSSCIEFEELHMPVECPNLQYLYLGGSKLSNLNLGLTSHLEILDLRRCNNFIDLNMPIICSKLKYLNLSGSKLSNLNLGLTPYLKELYLEECNDLVDLHMPVECPNLKCLYLGGSKLSNLNLMLTPHLERLDLENCNRLQKIHAPVGCLKMLNFLNLSGCSRFEYFVVDKGIELLAVESLAKLELVAEVLDICPLHPSKNLPKFRFKCKYDEPLLSWSGNLEKLISFGLCACTNLESFSASLCDLQELGTLKLEGSISEVPKNLHQLESLEELSLSMEKIKHLPDSICLLKHLKSIELKSCFLLDQLPKDLGSLECLEKLHLSDCISLPDIPSSICKIKFLKYLHLPYCVLVKNLPDDIGRLESLKELNIEGTGINHLPDSIFQLKDLCIVWSRGRLESYGFTSLKKLSRYTASCHIKNRKTQQESPQRNDSETSIVNRH